MKQSTKLKGREIPYKPILIAMLNDDELMAGGIFRKEKYYMEKYNVTQQEMDEMSIHIYFAAAIKTHLGRIN